MGIERLQQRITDFQSAVFRLEEACRQEETSFIRDSVIQRFEFCYDLSWKMLKLRLEAEGIEAHTPRATLQEALTAKFINDGSAWTELQKMRKQTSYTYDEALAKRVYKFVRDTGLELLKTLSEQSMAWPSDSVNAT